MDLVTSTSWLCSSKQPGSLQVARPVLPSQMRIPKGTHRHKLSLVPCSSSCVFAKATHAFSPFPLPLLCLDWGKDRTDLSDPRTPIRQDVEL